MARQRDRLKSIFVQRPDYNISTSSDNQLGRQPILKLQADWAPRQTFSPASRSLQRRVPERGRLAGGETA